MSEQEDEEFVSIISSNDMQRLQEESEIYKTSIRDLVTGLRYISEAMSIITDFIDSYFMAISEEMDDHRPGFTIESVICLKNIFESSKAFAESMLSEEYVNFDEDDIEFDEDDEDDEEEGEFDDDDDDE